LISIFSLAIVRVCPGARVNGTLREAFVGPVQPDSSGISITKLSSNRNLFNSFLRFFR